jgi:propanol-preferring alcohol dehydrogenase
MLAMQFNKPHQPLVEADVPMPAPQPTELLLKVLACGVCRTDLHIIDGELPNPKRNVIPGHEIVAVVEAKGSQASGPAVGTKVGVPWLGYTCGSCFYCLNDRENLCDNALFTGYTKDGGYAQYTTADSRFVFPLPESFDPISSAPLLCAGLIGWRSYRAAGEFTRLGIYGFGAAGHIIAQIACCQNKEVFAFTRADDQKGQKFARSLGAVWAGGSDERPPTELDAAIIFAPAGELIPQALRCVRKGGSVVSGGIHMSNIPQMPYDLLWGERSIKSVANLTRQDATSFMEQLKTCKVKTSTTTYPLAEANRALADLRHGRLEGAAVLSVV